MLEKVTVSNIKDRNQMKRKLAEQRWQPVMTPGKSCLLYMNK